MKTRPRSCSERERSKISWMTCWPGRSAGWALPANTIWTGPLLVPERACASRSASLNSRPARLYVANRRAKPIVRMSGSSAASSGIEDDRRLAVAGELVAEPAAGEDRQLELLALMGLPQLVRRELVEPLPEAAAVAFRVEVVEVGPRPPDERLAHRVPDPARHVDAVRDADDLPRRDSPPGRVRGARHAAG